MLEVKCNIAFMKIQEYKKEPANRANVVYELSSNGRKSIRTTRLPVERK
jgi:hypothetical protein